MTPEEFCARATHTVASHSTKLKRLRYEQENLLSLRARVTMGLPVTLALEELRERGIRLLPLVKV